MRPIISVVIVTYYHENYIRKAIDSVLNQAEIDNCEILIGDDGSTDGTLDILYEYEKKYPFIHVFAHENVGLSKNVYGLLKQAQGEYIAILEGDDYWIDSEKLRKQKVTIDNNNCVGTACNSLKVDNDGNMLGLWNHIKKSGLLSKKQVLLYQTSICHPSAIMFKNIFWNSGDKFDVIAKASRMGGNHTGMINLLANNGGIYFDTIPMTVWRSIQQSGSKNYSSQKFDKPMNYYEAMQKYEMYDSVFDYNYERHIYEEYSECKKALKSEFISTVGQKRYIVGAFSYYLFKRSIKLSVIRGKIVRGIKKCLSLFRKEDIK